MSYNASAERHRNYRAERVGRGGCTECSADAIEGETRCAEHKERARQRRARYEQRKRDASGRTESAMRIRREAVREERMRILIRWAETHGYVPSVSMTAGIVGLKGVFSPFYSELRRAAFGLRGFSRVEAGGIRRIPYPVPAEYLAEPEQVSA